MIYSKNSLAILYYQSKRAGYEPYVKFSAGIISELHFKFKVKVSKRKYREIKYRVKTQNLIPDSTDGSITVDAEDTYNNMAKAMHKFNQELFNPLHKSYYNDIDIEILNSCRAIAPCGTIPYSSYCDLNKKEVDRYFLFQEQCTEIDRRKAYTWAYNEITEIPVFNRFDIWKHYDYHKHDFNEFGDLTIYVVKAVGEAKMFFNKPYLLVYGMFLRHLYDKCEILYYKRPSHTHKVEYKSITDKLWNTNISDKKMEDTKI